MLDTNTSAAAAFYRLVREFSDSANKSPWRSGVIWHQVTPDEAHDLMLAARRAYGRSTEWVTVFAAAGLSHPDDPLKQQRLALPGEGALIAIKQRSGFESNPDYRQGFAPTWAGEELL